VNENESEPNERNDWLPSRNLVEQVLVPADRCGLRHEIRDANGSDKYLAEKLVFDYR
jgi:hypothetical protein